MRELLEKIAANLAYLKDITKGEEGEIIIECCKVLTELSHPENFCKECEKQNVVWRAPNELWKELYPNEGIVCPQCFNDKAEEKGYKLIFEAKIVN